jgi:hypothetical protein
MHAFKEVGQGWEHLPLNIIGLPGLKVLSLIVFPLLILHSVRFLQRLDKHSHLDNLQKLTHSLVRVKPQLSVKSLVVLQSLEQCAHQQNQHVDFQSSLEQVLLFVLELVGDLGQYLNVERGLVLALEPLLGQEFNTLLHVRNDRVIYEQVVAGVDGGDELVHVFAFAFFTFVLSFTTFFLLFDLFLRKLVHQLLEVDG